MTDGTNFINDKYVCFILFLSMSERNQIVWFHWHLITNIDTNREYMLNQTIETLDRCVSHDHQTVKHMTYAGCSLQRLRACHPISLLSDKVLKYLHHQKTISLQSRKHVEASRPRCIKERVPNKTLEDHAQVSTWLQIGCVRGTWQVALEKALSGLWIRNYMERCLCSINMIPSYQPKQSHTHTHTV